MYSVGSVTASRILVLLKTFPKYRKLIKNKIKKATKIVCTFIIFVGVICFWHGNIYSRFSPA